MRRLVPLLFTLLLGVPQEAHSGSFAFTISNSPKEGRLIVRAYDDPSSFGDFRNPIKEKHFSIDAVDQVFTLSDLDPGDYALLVFLDENLNGELDRNFIGIPREPIALSNDYQPRGPPSFNRARVTLARGQTLEQTLTPNRPLGDRGQIGVGLGIVMQSSPYVGSSGLSLQPIPAIVYIGDRLQVLGPVVNYNLYGAGPLRLAVRGEMRFRAYEEDDSTQLTGLGNRKTTVFGGLAMNSQLPAGFSLSLSYTHDLLGRIDAGTARASLSRGFQWGNVRLSPSVSVNWLDGDLANYEFGVPESAARADRPAYSLNDATNWAVGLNTMMELTPAWMATINLSYEILDDKIGESPIVDRRYLTRGFMAVTYTF
ncbi:MipA/OmpV family protein [Desulfurivibrio alkaliphilus]|uniref:DUF2141 domain-containing protein n=1 Tax=Desulfurivibrio alkaliphilus (strain DSM 19089 / UNIQEM U267 / AHT2) TaxID=589865 RepID=D6Z2E5_DESAT|nr:MipA/OmpV family protein [Desulfurivibrio alkaliphilus]ADH85720.1 Protein of unknown function DUF2141 [Desulfurivibrio alkaliphilus AHT 2]